MSQEIFDTIDPTISGTELATILNDFKDAIASGMSGTTRPTELQAGGMWVDTSGDPASWTLKLWTGVDDVEVVEIDLSTGAASVSLAVDSFIVRKVSADTVGAVMELVKRRIATNGQVLNGDVVGEVRMVGRDNVSNNPVVAKIIFEAAEDQTASAFGGNLTFYSTPAGQASLVSHMRFIGGQVETLVPHKINGQILVSQNVATAATIAQLSAEKVLVELTGSTATSIQGLNSSHSSKVVTLHNRSSAVVTLENQDAGAIAADRLLLPEGRDVVLNPEEAATLFYCVADSRWKVQYLSTKFRGFENDIYYPNVGSWVAPSTTTKVRVTAHSGSTAFPSSGPNSSNPLALDAGNLSYAWGFNGNGQLGVGDVVPRSSPVAVLGGLRFVKTLGVSNIGTTESGYGLTDGGVAYAWGLNVEGQLGVGDVVPRSSPVAVLGGLKFRSISSGRGHVLGLLADGTPYAWGYNVNGQLGVGDVVSRSSPVAVLGGLKFKEMISNSGTLGRSSYGLLADGTLYAWGQNANGELGVGDVTPRSSPVAVLGGLKFKKIISGRTSVFGITEAGVLYAWGLNPVGQLGVGDAVPRSSPVAVLGGLTFKDLSVDIQFGATVLGLTDSGALYAWGGNARGELGVGNVVAHSSPVAVLGGLTFQKAYVTFESSYGLTEDGSLYAWGVNTSGELGHGDVVPKSSPVAVLGGLSFREAHALSESFAGSAAFGITTEGKLYSWGANVNGTLGLGDVVPRSSPVAVLSGLVLKSQDDSTTVLDIPVVGGNTYAIQLGQGPCFFGNKPIGKDIQKVEVTYIE